MTLLQYASGHGDKLRPRWRDFFPRFRKRWGQGEHVFIYGETGSGKTDLNSRLLSSEPYGVMLVTKPRDPIFKSPLLKDYTRLNKWRPDSHKTHFILSSKPAKTMEEERLAQRSLFPRALDSMYAQGGWSISFDELMHMSTTLGMKQQASDIFYLGRSNGVTAIASTQRPAYIPVIVPQSAEHAFISRSRRADDIRTLSELGRDRSEIKSLMNQLHSKHDFIYLDTQENLPVQIVNTHY